MTALSTVSPARAEDGAKTPTVLTVTSKLGTAAVQSGEVHTAPAVRIDWVVTVAIDQAAARGQVELLQNGTVIQTAQVQATGKATLTAPASALLVGTYEMTARYLGDPEHAPSERDFTLVVEKRPLYPRLVGSHTSTFATNTRFSADRPINVRLDSMGAGTPALSPTGTVTFSVAGETVGTGELNQTQGMADVSSPIRLKAGKYTVTGTYPGSENFLPASGSRSFNVDLAPTTATLALESDVVGANDVVRATAAVVATHSVVTEGSVEFFVDGASAGSVPMQAGAALIELDSVDIGRQKVSATYTDDSGTYMGSVAVPAVVQVDRAETVTTLELDQANVSGSQRLQATSRVLPASATGSVQFSANGTVLGNATLVDGVASRALTVPTGARQIEAKYLGDRRHIASIAVPAVVSTSLQSTVTNVTVANPKPRFGDEVAITVKVSDGAKGTVELFVDGESYDRSPLSDGAATFAVAANAYGRHLVSARFLGTQAFDASESGNRAFSVGDADVDIAKLKLSSSATVFGVKTVTVTAQVAGPDGVQVRLTAGPKNLGTTTVKKRAVSWTLPKNLAVGNYSLEARHVTAAGKLEDSSGTKSLTVRKAAPASVKVALSKLKAGKAPTATVRVAKLNNGAFPVGTATVRWQGKTYSAPLKAAHRGIVKLKVGKAVAGKHAYVASFTPADSKNVAGKTSSKKQVNAPK